jgi:hypothetical protein
MLSVIDCLCGDSARRTADKHVQIIASGVESSPRAK